MLCEDRLYGFALAAMGQVEWEHGTPRNDESRAARTMQIAVAMEAAFSATLRDRRDAAEQAAKKAREDAARAEAPRSSGGPPCIHCGDDAESHAVDDEERRECMAPGCKCRQYECAAVQTAPVLAACDWTTHGTPCGRPAAATRVQRGLTRERPFCAAHESAGEALGYWLPKAAP